MMSTFWPPYSKLPYCIGSIRFPVSSHTSGKRLVLPLTTANPVNSPLNSLGPACPMFMRPPCGSTPLNSDSCSVFWPSWSNSAMSGLFGSTTTFKLYLMPFSPCSGRVMPSHTTEQSLINTCVGSNCGILKFLNFLKKRGLLVLGPLRLVLHRSDVPPVA